MELFLNKEEDIIHLIKKKKFYTGMILSVSLVFICSFTQAEPSKSQVEQAVNDYFGDDKASTISHENLKKWGNKALPHLKEMAINHKGYKGSWHIICSINELKTKEGIDFLIEIADGKTGIKSDGAVLSFGTMIHNAETKDYLKGHKKFKKIMFKLASHESWLTRGQIAEIMAEMGWQDSLLLLKQMLQDNNLNLRQDAAEAIFKLTGEKVSAAIPEMKFPKVELKEHLVKYIGIIPLKQQHTVRFGQWFDGMPGILQTGDKFIGFINHDLDTVKKLIIDKFAYDILMLPVKKGEKAQAVASVSDKQTFFSGNYVASFDSEGNELWKYRPSKSGVKALIPLYDTQGNIIQAIVGFGGSEGMVALDHKGKVVWQVPNFDVLYEIKTASEVPNKLVVCGGSVAIIDEHGQINSSTKDKTVTEGGDVLIFDQEGTLHFKQMLQTYKKNGKVNIYGIDSGFMDDKEFYIGISTLKGTLIYQLKI